MTGVAAAGSQSGKAEDMSYAGTFTVSVVPAGKELKGVGGPLETIAGVPFPEPFVVNVFRNDTDAAISEEPVVFNLKDAAGTVVQTKAGTTGPDGTASMNFTVADPGDYKVEANCAGCAAGNPAVFPMSVRSFVIRLEKVPGAESGDRQREKAGVKLPIPLRVRVRREDGVLLPNIQIQFSRLSGPTEPQFSAAIAVTDSSGVAETDFTAPAGVYEILAFCPSCTGPTAGFSIAAAPLGEGTASPDFRPQIFYETTDNPGPVARQSTSRGNWLATRSACGATLQMRDVFRNGDRVDFKEEEIIPWCLNDTLRLICASPQGRTATPVQCMNWQLLEALPPDDPFTVFDPGHVNFTDDSVVGSMTPLRPALFAVQAFAQLPLSTCRTTPRRVLAQDMSILAISVSPRLGDPGLVPGKKIHLRVTFPFVNTRLITPTKMRRFISIDIVDFLTRTEPRDPPKSIWVFETPDSAQWVGQDLDIQFETLRGKTAAPHHVEMTIQACLSLKSIELDIGDASKFP